MTCSVLAGAFFPLIPVGGAVLHGEFHGEIAMIADKERLLLKIFHDYYVRNLSQNEIAERHLISRKKVQRYLEKGRSDNLVEVKIRFPSRMYGELESALEDKYDLLEALVADVDEHDDGGAMMLRNVSDMASDYFLRVLSPGMTVSLTWSRHVALMMDIASRKVDTLREKPKNVMLVLTLGAVMGGAPDLRTLEAARLLANGLNGEIQIMMAPSITTSSDIQRAIMDEPQIYGIVEMARKADVAFFGIGSITGDSLQLPMVEQLMPEVAERLRTLGAVGDINGHFFDAGGNPVYSELDERLVGLTIEDIKAMPLTVGIATGANKTEAIRSALTGRLLKVLVVDVDNARKLVR